MPENFDTLLQTKIAPRVRVPNERLVRLLVRLRMGGETLVICAAEKGKVDLPRGMAEGEPDATTGSHGPPDIDTMTLLKFHGQA